MWVVKLGGSLATDIVLADWLRLLAPPRRVPIVIVPGGGAFADCVRGQQARWKFGDAAAHAMALLAMAQFGLMLEALCPALVVETSLVQLQHRRDGGVGAIWLPLELLREPDAIETSWSVTSDSLAAWLARKLDADRLFLVKSCALPSRCTLAALADAGIVDRRFPESVRDARFDVDIVDKHDLGRMAALLGQRSDAPIG